MKTLSNNMKKLFFVGWMLIAGVVAAMAQDYSLINHNVVPFALNPAQAGNANATRFALSFRQQWPQLANHFTTARVSFDRPFYKRMCSLGLAYNYDDYAGGVYRTNDFAAVYAHTFELTENSFFRLGLQGSLFVNHFGFDKLEYGDQYDKTNGRIDPNTIEDFDKTTCTFFDFSAGMTYYIENKFSIGGAVYHIAEPENGFLDKSANALNRRFVVHANYMHDLIYGNGLWGRNDLSDKYLYLNANYQTQADWQTAYLGLGLYLAPVVLGVSERTNLDEVYTTAFQLGCTYKGLQVYYTFDLFTSDKLNGSWSHQIDLIYIIQIKEKYPCPMVYW